MKKSLGCFVVLEITTSGDRYRTVNYFREPPERVAKTLQKERPYDTYQVIDVIGLDEVAEKGRTGRKPMKHFEHVFWSLGYGDRDEIGFTSCLLSLLKVAIDQTEERVKSDFKTAP